MVGACNLFRTITLSQQYNNGFLKKIPLIYFGIYVKFLHRFLKKELDNSAIEAGRPWEAHYTSKASKRSKSEAIFDFSFLNRPASYKGKVRKTNSLVSSLLCSPQKNLILLFTSNIFENKIPETRERFVRNLFTIVVYILVVSIQCLELKKKV